MDFLAIFFSVAATLAVSCCSVEHPVKNALENAENIIMEHPDSALILLRKIDRSSLSSGKERADFSLLYSMALDKCYIDTTDDGVINVAVNYYKKHKPLNKRFMSLYYQARVYENAKDDEKAMQSISEAGSIREEAVDTSYRIKALYVKARIYMRLFQCELQNETYEKISELTYASKSWGDYIQCSLDRANVNIILHNYHIADSLIRLVSNYWDKASDKRKSLYYSDKLLLLIRQGAHPDTLRSVLAECESFRNSHARSVSKTLNVAASYITLGDYEKALASLSEYAPDGNTDNPAYYSYLHKAYAGLGQYENAYNAYKGYVRYNDENDMDIITHDTKFIEERYSSQIKQIKDRNKITLLVLLGIILLLLTTVSITKLRRKSREKELLANDFDSLKNDFELLQQAQKEATEYNDSLKTMLGVRASALAAFLHSTPKKIIDPKRLKDLMGDRTAIIETLGMMFAIKHPEFASMLSNKGLTASEIGYCSLFLMGYSSKEVGDIICRASYFNISSAIRKKLGLGVHDTNLPLWLKQQMDSIKEG